MRTARADEPRRAGRLDPGAGRPDVGADRLTDGRRHWPTTGRTPRASTAPLASPALRAARAARAASAPVDHHRAEGLGGGGLERRPPSPGRPRRGRAACRRRRRPRPAARPRRAARACVEGQARGRRRGRSSERRSPSASAGASAAASTACSAAALLGGATIALGLEPGQAAARRRSARPAGGRPRPPGGHACRPGQRCGPSVRSSSARARATAWRSAASSPRTSAASPDGAATPSPQRSSKAARASARPRSARSTSLGLGDERGPRRRRSRRRARRAGGPASASSEAMTRGVDAGLALLGQAALALGEHGGQAARPLAQGLEAGELVAEVGAAHGVELGLGGHARRRRARRGAAAGPRSVSTLADAVAGGVVETGAQLGAARDRRGTAAGR